MPALHPPLHFAGLRFMRGGILVLLLGGNPFSTLTRVRSQLRMVFEDRSAVHYQLPYIAGLAQSPVGGGPCHLVPAAEKRWAAPFRSEYLEVLDSPCRCLPALAAG